MTEIDDESDGYFLTSEERYQLVTSLKEDGNVKLARQVSKHEGLDCDVCVELYAMEFDDE